MFLPRTTPILPAAYAPLAAFIAPARARAELWRIGAALAMTVLGFIILTQTALTLLTAVANAVVGPFWAEAVWRSMEGGRSALGVVAVLASFVPLAIALALAVRVLHKPPLQKVRNESESLRIVRIKAVLPHQGFFFDLERA